jgi:soluble lytic murein transglycosylase-like protein
MKTNKKNEAPIIWRTIHQNSKKRWKINFLLLNLFYLTIIVSAGWWVFQNEKAKEVFALQKQELNVLKTKESVYLILRNRGVSLSQGLDIAEVTIRQSKKLNLPISLILAVMEKESTFTPHALSSQNAMGLMQVHPITWGEYVSKLNLKVSIHAAFDPVTNIIVATHVLKDRYEYYKKTARSEEEIWKSVLSAYYAGMTSLSQTGMTESHVKYVADVNKFKKEFDEKLQN